MDQNCDIYTKRQLFNNNVQDKIISRPHNCVFDLETIVCLRFR